MLDYINGLVDVSCLPVLCQSLAILREFEGVETC